MDQLEKIISLNFNRKDFEEIYFRNNQGNILLSPIVKQEFITLMIFLVFLFGTTVYSLITDKNAWLVIVLSIFTIIACIPYYNKALQLLKWRKAVKDFLNKNERFKTHKLVLTESSLSVIQDGNEDIQKWAAFTHIEITENYLLLTGPIQYFFPKKSMLIEDYDYFIKEIKSHIKNNL